MNKQEKSYHKIAWIAEIAASPVVSDRKGNAFIVEKIVNVFYTNNYYHCYLSILALLSIEIIDSLGSLSCRYYFLRFDFTPHIIWTSRHNCHLDVYKLKMEGKIKYFHSKTFLGVTAGVTDTG